MDDTIVKLLANDGVTGFIAYLIITKVDKRLDDFVSEVRSMKRLLKKIAKKEGVDVSDVDDD